MSQFCITIDNTPSLCNCLCCQYSVHDFFSICADATCRLTRHLLLVGRRFVELETNGFQLYAIANLEKTSLYFLLLLRPY